MKIQSYDVAIAGSGPTACVLAKELAKAGKSVLVMERGDASKTGLGTPFSMVNRKHAESCLPKSLFTPTVEGETVLIGVGLGGGSKLASGGAFIPDFDLFRKYDMDLEPFLEDSMRESWVSRRPDRYLGHPSYKMQEISKKLGIPMEVSLAHVNWDKCPGCNYSTLGCKHGAKWEGRYAAEDAMMYGAEFMFNTMVTEAIIENGKAVGFRMKNLKTKERHEVRAKIVVSACGGRDSVKIAKRAGMEEAGSWFTGDPTLLTVGFMPPGQEGAINEPAFSVNYNDKENGAAYALCGIGFSNYFSQYFMSEPVSAVKDLLKYKRVVYVFTKMHDDDQGWVDAEGRMSKVYTEGDRKRIALATRTNERLLIEYGCDPDDLHHQKMMLGHPSGTVRVGPLLDKHLQSKLVPNLYFCDTSIFPEAVGAPPILTLVCLAKYFAKHLVEDVL